MEKAINPSTSIEVNQLTVQFGDFTAVRNLSLKVFKGEIFGFLGANGAGKTTTIRVLSGLLQPSSGSVRVLGLNPQDGLQAIKERVGYMSQKFTLYNDLTVKENLAFTASLRKLTKSYYQRRQQELLEFMGFKRSLNTLVRDLPGGLKQQIALLAAILHDPEVIFLDEPTAGVTPTYRQRFFQLINELASQGKSILVTTHYMDEAEQCARIALMREGALIALDTPANLKTQTFKGLLYELTPPDDQTAWLKTLQAAGICSTLKPHGLHYHAELQLPHTAAELQRLLPPNVTYRRIQPALEDVFIRLVEGEQA